MADIDNNILMGLLIIAEEGLLASQKRIQAMWKQRKWLRPWMRKRDGKGVYCSIINNPSLTDKEDFRKYLRLNTLAAIPILSFCLTKNQNCVSPLFLCLFQFLRHGIQKLKWDFIVFYSQKKKKKKKNINIFDGFFLLIIKTKFIFNCFLPKKKKKKKKKQINIFDGLILFIIQKSFVWVKNVTFLYILNIFFTMLQMKIVLEFWIILYIFR